MKDVKVVHIPGKIYWYRICVSQVLHFHTSRISFYATSGWIFGKTSGSPTKFWDCQGPKCFEWFAEWHRSEFSGKYPWQSTISGKGGGRGEVYVPPFFGGITPLNVVNFVWNFDQWWNARWYIKYATIFIEVLRNGWNCAKKLIFLTHFKFFWVFLVFSKWSMQFFWQGEISVCQVLVAIKVMAVKSD